MCLSSKIILHKPYKELQLLPVLTYHWKIFSMDFVTGLLLLTNWKGENDDSIFVIVNRLTKMVY